MKYTKEDLLAVHEEYEANFKLILANIDTPGVWKYQQEEHRLEKKCQIIQKALKVFISSPCPLKVTTPCEECSGFYRIRRNPDKGKPYKSIFEECGEDPEGYRCPIKDIQLVFQRKGLIDIQTDYN